VGKSRNGLTRGKQPTGGRGSDPVDPIGGCAPDGRRFRAGAAGIKTRVGNHTFRATGITAYLKDGGSLENAAAMANHASTRTTQLYDRRRDEMSLDEVERISI
jgi:integrase